MKNILIIVIGLLVSGTVFSQDGLIQTEKAQEQLNRRGEVYFQFTLRSNDDVELMSNRISIDNLNGNQITAYANAIEFSKFLEYTRDFKVLTPPSEKETVNMSDDPRQVMEWNYYPTYPAYESMMTQFATDHPDICSLVTIGTLASGRKLLALKITDNPDIQENEPEFLYTSSIHGDETTGYILMLHLIDYLLTNYGVDPRITEMVNSMEIYINPLANPDGTYKGGNNSVNGATRGNANNVDLNRNYADPEDGPHPDGNPWQPETVAFMNFAGFHHFTMGANFHGGAEVVNYPWDTWPRLAADDNWWIYTSREYADTVHANAPPNYLRDLDNGISNGYAWYTISGGRQDYMNYFRNCREVTIEISSTKLLPTSQLINHWNYNYRSFLNYLEESTYGLNGLVTDSMSGQPLNARVFIAGYDIDSSHVFTDPSVGDYHRLLKSGLYNVTFSSPGYTSRTFPVQITDQQKMVLNVQLYNGRLETNFGCDTTIVPVGSTVHFMDQSAGNPQTWQWEFEGGSPAVSTQANPSVTYNQPGKYSVKLIVTRPGVVDSLIRADYIDVKQWYLMGNESYSLCDALFYDAGGPQAGYSNNESSLITFVPSVPGNRLKATFLSMGIEYSADCSNDWLKVFDGTNAEASLIGTYCGSDIPPVILASNSQGALTFQFHANDAITGNGWEAILECDSNVGIDVTRSLPFTLYPNPITSGSLTVIAKKPIARITLCDAVGHEVMLLTPGKSEVTIPCQMNDGLYYVRIQLEGLTFTEKVIIINRP